MGLKLYMVMGSPPVNAVLMTARALNLQLELRELDFAKKEYLEEWYVKINPSHTVPALDDNGFILWDSHAIILYMLETYGKNSSLYYAHTKEKFKILQLLNLDCGTIFRRLSDCIRPLFYEQKTTIDSKHLHALKSAYNILERLLVNDKFLAGERFTVADISVFSSMAVSNLFLPLAEEEHPHLKKWFMTLQSLDAYKACEPGIEAVKLGLQSKLGPEYTQIE